ncbi:hypothetical protein AYK24_03650 [Thermoplasmatales archaeon SG8-52-4]|nr:MAG: hypothetical protein AYK24_03650 [Thermoplasmatales archaeon SG8-52-4]
MAVKKCIKCDARIPAGAGFCPACGAPVEENQKTPKSKPTPVESKPIRSGQNGLQDIIKLITSQKIMVLCFVLAILIAWITRIINQYQPSYSDSFTAVNIINFTFMAGIGGLLLLGGLINNKINIYLRGALIITGGIFLVLNL